MKRYFNLTDKNIETIGGFPMEPHECHSEPGHLWKFKYAPHDINTEGTMDNMD
jgi:hypothetical protein